MKTRKSFQFDSRKINFESKGYTISNSTKCNICNGLKSLWNCKFNVIVVLYQRLLQVFFNKTSGFSYENLADFFRTQFLKEMANFRCIWHHNRNQRPTSVCLHNMSVTSFSSNAYILQFNPYKLTIPAALMVVGYFTVAFGLLFDLEIWTFEIYQ